jgi:hypothetical protein
MNPQNSMSPNELAGVALNSPSIEEIQNAIHRSLESADDDVAVQVILALGHIARRFGRIDVLLVAEVLCNYTNYPPSEKISDAKDNMLDDFRHFLKKETMKLS